MKDLDVAPPLTTAPVAPAGNWWGEFELESGRYGYWLIGPLQMWVGRTESRWEIATARGETPFLDRAELQLPTDLERNPIPLEADRRRVAFARTSGKLTLQPMLADRPIVARPETPFAIPRGERVDVFVSSAVWISLSCTSQQELLIETPTWRASDTWFGDNRTGFLCYSTSTAMRLQVDALPHRPHRVVTPIVIENKGRDTLRIERISLPIPNLSVFVSDSGALWTERLILTRDDDAELAHVHIEREALPVPDARLLREPRETGQENLLSRVFTGLFA